MILFEYVGVTLKGEYIRGELEAADRYVLIKMLWERRLFLVWNKVKDVQPPENGPLNLATGEFAFAPRSDDLAAIAGAKDWKRLPNERRLFGTQPLRVTLLSLCAVLIASLLFDGYYYLYRRPRMHPALQYLPKQPFPIGVKIRSTELNFKYIRADRAQFFLEGEIGRDVRLFEANHRSNTLIVMASSDTVQRAIQLAPVMDQPDQKPLSIMRRIRDFNILRQKKNLPSR